MRTDLIRRAVLPVAALVALLAGAPRPVVGGLALVGLAVVAEGLARLRRRGTADLVLVVVGGLLVTLVLTGLLLDVTTLGLTPTTWVGALVVLSGVGLMVSIRLPARTPAAEEPTGSTGSTGSTWSTGSTAWRTVPWVAAAALVVGLAVHVSGGSLAGADAEPVEMSFGRVSGSQVQVVVSAHDAAGPFEVRTSAGGNDISYPLFSVEAGGSATTTVSLPATGRYVVTLSYPDQTEPLRSIVLDR